MDAFDFPHMNSTMPSYRVVFQRWLDILGHVVVTRILFADQKYNHGATVTKFPYTKPLKSKSPL